MNGNSKTSIGLLIPATSFIVFTIAIYFENFSFSMFSAICGILIWFLYTAVMQTKLPDVTGNIIILFGLLISIGYFLNFGISNNMFGGIDFNKETIIGSLMILLISVVLGVLFNNSFSGKETSKSTSYNSDKDIEVENKTAEPKKELDRNLEQLRALENNMKIHVGYTLSSPLSVDTEEDFNNIKELMKIWKKIK